MYFRTCHDIFLSFHGFGLPDMSRHCVTTFSRHFFVVLRVRFSGHVTTFSRHFFVVSRVRFPDMSRHVPTFSRIFPVIFIVRSPGHVTTCPYKKHPATVMVRGVPYIRLCGYYLARACATSTAQATVQPTIGLLPMPRNPIISTCAGTEDEPANWASECMRPIVSVIP